MKKLLVFVLVILAGFIYFKLKKPDLTEKNWTLTTETGWSNDLQTIIWNEAGGYYDLYFLHSADGPLNPLGASGQDWVHTTTSDFIHFSPQETAIVAHSPVANSWKSAWTGSVFLNSGEIAELETGQAVAYFSGLDSESGKQMIYATASSDGGKTFTQFLNDGAPLLTTENASNQQDFRDPYVFAMGEQLWMYIAEGDEIGVYRSSDGIAWETPGVKIGSDQFFKGKDWTGNTPIECPVIKTMTTPSGQLVQVLFFGAKNEKVGETTGTYYVVGQIQEDGSFQAETEVRRLDLGSDYYGANFSGSQTIEESNASLISMGWIGNWNYFTNGVHQTQDNNSPYLETLGAYSSPRQLTLTNDLTIEESLFIEESSFKLTEESQASTDQPAKSPQVQWTDELLAGQPFYGLYDLPNRPATGYYHLTFSSQDEQAISSDLAIVIWQEADVVQLIYSPQTGQLSVQASAEELKNGQDGSNRAYDYYKNGLASDLDGYRVELIPLQSQEVQVSIITSDRSIEFFLPNGQTYTVSRFNSSSKQDFKVFSSDEKIELQLKRLELK